MADKVILLLRLSLSDKGVRYFEDRFTVLNEAPLSYTCKLLNANGIDSMKRRIYKREMNLAQKGPSIGFPMRFDVTVKCFEADQVKCSHEIVEKAKEIIDSLKTIAEKSEASLAELVAAAKKRKQGKP